MPVLPNSKHERFAQSIMKGLTATAAYVSAGYAKASARKNAPRLMSNDVILSRISELKNVISQGVVASEIRKRSWRVQPLQDWADDMLALRAARKVMYANQMGEGRTLKVNNAAEEKQAIAEGFSELAIAPAGDLYPKALFHPGYPNGGATGMLVKDYRGKNAEQEVWRFDAALVEKFLNTLKQAAIEEGQWTEKREMAGTNINVMMDLINEGRARAAREQEEREERARLAVTP
jgi:hypothetical protein